MHIRKKLGFVGVGVGTIFILILPRFVEIHMADFYTQLAVGVILLTIGIGYWTFKPEIEKFTATIAREERQEREHTEFLTENVYRKLMRVEAHQDYKNFITLMIPRDPRAFSSSKSQTYISWLVDKISGRVEEPINSIESTIPHLKRGMEHLQDKYKEIYKYCEKVGGLLEQYEGLVNNIKASIIDKVKTEMQKNFPTFIEFDGWGTKNSYFSERIAKTLYYYSFHEYEKGKIPDFELNVIQIQGDNVWRINANETVMQSPNAQDLDPAKLKQVLISICVELDLVNKFDELYKIHVETNNNLELFRNLLEEKIVDLVDAKGGYVIKGKCEACR